MLRIGISVCVSIFGLSAICLAGEVPFERIKLDDTFRAEGAAVGDFNKDGKLDVAAGDYWYAAPDWKMSRIRQPLTQQGKPTDAYDGSKGYSNCFASWSHDINQDGWDDIIIIGYPGDPCYWYENPRNQPGDWKQYEIWHSACNETVLFTDLTGDGRPELILGSQPERQMGYLTLPSVEKCHEKWAFTPISDPGDPNENGTFKYYHGLGTGDLNQDGRLDVIIPHGWWEAPAKQESKSWTFHPLPLAKDNQGKPVEASNIFVMDLDLDGDNDLILSSAHAFGIWWFENPGAGSGDMFKYHLIDESFSQTHALDLVDFTGKGKPALVTGKRYFAHMGSDPGEFQPVVMYWFDIERAKGQPPKFVKHEITAGKDTGVGTQMTVVDFNKDGRLDLVLSNKKGVNLLIQQK
ncbi:FG-GAP repeat domain-containing protein [Schlesneria paludicola]|uniref:FG-GAP repeat domain-containing protein n=1 Tax=Schlesneria paludicola TaxID=360056 RepID=UPI00029ADA94|nr:VCBS repeat-containing protein [Schlesneria paludicola]